MPRMGRQKPSSSSRRSTVTFVPVFVSQTFVQRIYDSILSALESGVGLKEALQTYTPLLLNELDKLLMMYPYASELFIDTIRRMWVRWFKDIPMPAVTPDDSAMAVMNKIVATLKEHRKKIVSPTGYASTTEEEVMRQIEYTALSFMHSVCSFVFSMLGVIF